MLDNCPFALNIHIYNYANHLAELYEIGAKTKRKSGKSTNYTCNNKYSVLLFFNYKMISKGYNIYMDGLETS